MGIHREIQRSPEQLTQLAKDIRAGLVWHDRVKVEGCDPMRAFTLPLQRLSEEARALLLEQVKTDEFFGEQYSGCFYEYLDKAKVKEENMVPIFDSFEVLSSAEYAALRKIQDALDISEAESANG